MKKKTIKGMTERQNLRNGLLFCAAFVMAPLMELIIGKDWGARFRGAAGEE